ncbi:FAD-dependent oxidoreductase [Pseudarcicella hirudinis]|uniref:FAD-dependent oxidoreductase n=1 Tax=Pseudarcicella hirudinis TaxID=1079859 RepID=UPI0035E568D4
MFTAEQKTKPCTQEELNIAKLDGCKFEYLASPKQVVGQNGKVSGLICDKMTLGEPDESGRRSPVSLGETFELEVDMVIKAAGQTPFESLIKSSNILHKNGKILTDDSLATNLSTVFAGGDCINGGKEVVNAVQDGKDAATAILRYLGVNA